MNQSVTDFIPLEIIILLRKLGVLLHVRLKLQIKKWLKLATEWLKLASYISML